MAAVVPLVQYSNHRARVVCCVVASIEHVSTTASIIASKPLVICLSFHESQVVCNLRQGVYNKPLESVRLRHACLTSNVLWSRSYNKSCMPEFGDSALETVRI
jgi:hypothetical protein